MTLDKISSSNETTYAFDAEPLVAYLLDEDGSDTVEDILKEIREGEAWGSISPVTKMEVHYVGIRCGLNPDEIVGFLTSIKRIGVVTVPAENAWELASVLKNTHHIPLGDAFAVASATGSNTVLVVGADDDFEDIPTVQLLRFREHAV